MIKATQQHTIQQILGLDGEDVRTWNAYVHRLPQSSIRLKLEIDTIWFGKKFFYKIDYKKYGLQINVLVGVGRSKCMPVEIHNEDKSPFKKAWHGLD